MEEEEQSTDLGMTNFWRAKTAQEIADIINAAVEADQALNVNQIYKEALICIVSGTAAPFFTINNATTKIVGRTKDIKEIVKDLQDKVSVLQEDILIIKEILNTIKIKTDNIPAFPAAVGSEMNLVVNAITKDKIFGGAFSADKFDINAFDSSKFADGTFTAPKFSDNAISSRVIAKSALTADKFGLGVISLDSLEPSVILAIQEGLALSSDLAAGINNLNDVLEAIDVVVKATMERVKRIPKEPAMVGSAMALIDNAVDESKITGLAVRKMQNKLPSSAELSELDEKLNTMSDQIKDLTFKINQINMKTQNLPEFPASAGSIPTAENIAESVSKRMKNQ